MQYLEKKLIFYRQVLQIADRCWQAVEGSRSLEKIVAIDCRSFCQLRSAMVPSPGLTMLSFFVR